MEAGKLIPGQTPLDDISGLRLKKVRTQVGLNAAEAENIRRVVVRYLLNRPSRGLARFDVAWAMRLHKEMFGRVWAWAGSIRTRELNLGSPVHQIEGDLVNLFDDLKAWGESGMARVEQAARLHHRAVSVHPFLNGNGRWGRMLANIWLRVNGEPLTVWPEVVIGTASVVREEYLKAMKAGDRGEYEPLVQLHEKFAEGSPG